MNPAGVVFTTTPGRMFGVEVTKNIEEFISALVERLEWW
jgi:hypothetical protein